jgi:hypothetical protein
MLAENSNYTNYNVREYIIDSSDNKNLESSLVFKVKKASKSSNERYTTESSTENQLMPFNI